MRPRFLFSHVFAQHCLSFCANVLRQASGYFPCPFLVDAGPDFFGKVGRDFAHSVGGAGVLGALLQYFLLGLTPGHKVTIHANVSAADDLCHKECSFHLMGFAFPVSSRAAPREAATVDGPGGTSVASPGGESWNSETCALRNLSWMRPSRFFSKAAE
jgi:hypothetical protein